jgi:hypothetical protein
MPSRAWDDCRCVLWNARSVHGAYSELIVRDWHQILKYRLTADGRCASCGERIKGRFEPFARQLGRQ